MTGSGTRLPELSYFFPAHNEAGNVEALVADALEALPALAERYEIIVVNDGSSDQTGALADALAAAQPEIVRVIHHPINLGYGAALRSGFRVARYDWVGFTDGDRQFAVSDLGRLTSRIAQPDQPDVVVGFRIRRADPLIRSLYARSYRLANRIFFGLRTTDVDCACKLFRRAALRSLRVESGGAWSGIIGPHRRVVDAEGRVDRRGDVLGTDVAARSPAVVDNLVANWPKTRNTIPTN